MWDAFERRFQVEKVQKKEYESVVGNYEGDIETIDELPSEYHIIHFRDGISISEDKPYLIRIRLNILSPLLGGFVSEDEKKTLKEIETKIEEELTKLRVSFIKVGIEIGSSLYTIDFYSSSIKESEIEYQLEDLQEYYLNEEKKEYFFQLYITEDKTWNHYVNYLTPTKYERRWMKDRDIIKKLILQEDMVNVPREITHRLQFTTQENHFKFIQLAEEIGFSVVNSSNECSVDVKREDEVLFRSLHFVVLDLMITAEKLNGEYLTWFCDVVKEIPYHPLKEELYA